MTEILLIRHAINDWVATGKLAGWTPGVHLSAVGQKQAAALGEHLASARITAIYASPLERTMETAQAIAQHYPTLSIEPLEGVGEVRFGDWQGAKLKTLRRESLWQTVQLYPSRAQFPHGEAFRHAQIRAVDAIEMLVRRHPRGRVAVVSHSDIIKLIVTYYLGAPLDAFQRIEVSPASISVLYLSSDRPTLVRLNDTSFLPKLAAPPPRRRSLWTRLLGR